MAQAARQPGAGLNFLNLQLQMLDGAVKRGDAAEVEEILPLLRTGVDESYQDVRELLTNFRSKLSQGDLYVAIEDTVDASAARPAWIPSWQWASAAPLAPDQQLQVLFILQEALSNVRKHSEAARVRVEVEDGRDFVLDISDDGQGYDAEEVAARGEAHVGLHIMRERAARMRAVIKLESRPGQARESSDPARRRTPGRLEEVTPEALRASHLGGPLQGRRRGPAKPAPRDPAELSHGPRDRGGRCFHN